MRILVVDDDAGIRVMLRELLEEEGYTVSVAGDGAEALRAIRARTEPMVALLDLLLPALSGEETLAAALASEHERERDQQRPAPPLTFVIITATSDISVTPALRAILRAHDIAVVRKPFDNDLLLATVERAAARARVAG